MVISIAVHINNITLLDSLGFFILSSGILHELLFVFFTLALMLRIVIADMQSTIDDWNGWLRRRIRMYIWKRWKRPKTRVANLEKLGGKPTETAILEKGIGLLREAESLRTPSQTKDLHKRDISIYPKSTT